mgnify:CR=1 FL=1
MKNLLYFILVLFVFISCKHELERPSWETDNIIPLVNSKMTINDIIIDNGYSNYFDIDSNNIITLKYNSELINTNNIDLLGIESTNKEKTFTIDSVQFDDVEINYLLSIEDVINDIPFGTILFPNGSQREIPQLPSIIQDDTILIDASEYFETMTLYNGNLNFKFTNNFPTDLSNIVFSLYNANNQNLIANINISMLQSGETYSETLSVAGETIDYLMTGIIHNIDLEQSNGLVLINYDDDIISNISISDIQIMEATAYFPNQLLHQELVEQSFDIGSARLTELGIKNGEVIINAASSLPDTISVIYIIPSLTKNNKPFEVLVKIPPNINNNYTELNFNFDGYVMNLEGKEGRSGGDTVNTIYSEMYLYLDSTGELETINKVDSFKLFNQFIITPEYARGYIGNDTFNIETIDKEISLFNNIHSGEILLEKLDLNLTIKNNVGSDAKIIFNELNFDNTNDNNPPISLNIDKDGNNIIGYPYMIERASLTDGNLPVIPKFLEIETQSTEILEMFPNKVNISSTIILNPNVQTSVSDFIFLDNTIEANIEASMPLSFVAKKLEISKIFDADLSSNNRSVEELIITIDNGIPLQAKLEVILMDSESNILDTLITNHFIYSAITSEDDLVISNNESVISISDYNFDNVKKVKINSTFNTSNLNNSVDIYNHYEMGVKLSARFKQIIE